MLNGLLVGTAQDKKKLDSLSNLLNTTRNGIQRVNILNILASQYTYVNIAKMNQYAKEALTLSEKLNYPKGKIQALKNLASVYSYHNRQIKTIEYLFLALKIAEVEYDSLNIADLYSRIGYNYTLQKEFKKAELYCQKAIDLQALINKPEYENSLAGYLGNMGIVYGEQGLYKEELKYYEKALQIAQKFKDSLSIAIHLNNMGEAYLGLKDYDKALGLFRESRIISEKLNDQEGLVVSNNNIAKIYILQDKIDQAEALALQSIEIGKQSESDLFLKDAYEILYEIYFKKQDFKKALEYFKLSESISKRIYENDAKSKIAQINELYESEKKEQELARQKILQNQQKLTIRRQQLTIFIFIGTIFLVLLLAFLLFRANQAKRKNNEQLKELNEVKDKLFSIIAHDFKSPLNSLQATLTLLNSDELSESELKFLLKGLAGKVNDTQNLLDNLLNWAKTQMKGLEVKPQPISLSKIIQENIQLLLPLAEKKHIYLAQKVDPNLHVFADLEMIKVVIRNLLTNAIKFTSEEGTVTIEAIKNSPRVGWTQISVADTGVGIHPEVLPKIFSLKTYYSEDGTAKEKGTGLGLILAKDFVERNQGTITVESQQDKGSVFSFTLPNVAH